MTINSILTYIYPSLTKLWSLQMKFKSTNLYTLEEVAEYLKISYRNVLLLVHSKKIKSFKIGKMYRIYGFDLSSYLKKNQYRK